MSIRIPILNWLLDERFLDRRRRSTSVAGIIGALTAIGLFEYRYFVDRTWSWDLLAVALVFVAVKLMMMAWYAIRD